MLRNRNNDSSWSGFVDGYPWGATILALQRLLTASTDSTGNSDGLRRRRYVVRQLHLFRRVLSQEIYREIRPQDVQENPVVCVYSTPAVRVRGDSRTIIRSHCFRPVQVNPSVRRDGFYEPTYRLLVPGPVRILQFSCKHSLAHGDVDVRGQPFVAARRSV